MRAGAAAQIQERRTVVVLSKIVVDRYSISGIINSSKTHVEISVPIERVSQWHLADIFTDIKTERWQAVGRNLWGFVVHMILRFYILHRK